VWKLQTNSVATIARAAKDTTTKFRLGAASNPPDSIINSTYHFVKNVLLKTRALLIGCTLTEMRAKRQRDDALACKEQKNIERPFAVLKKVYSS